MRRLVILLALPLVAAAFQTRRPAPKARVPDVAFLEFKARREERVLAVEGIIRNDSSRSLRAVVVFFEFLDADDHPISRKSTQVSEKTFDPGDELPFEAQTSPPARAVSIRLEVQSRGVQISAAKTGPYLIE
jgi:hypothetical protein